MSRADALYWLVVAYAVLATLAACVGWERVIKLTLEAVGPAPRRDARGRFTRSR